MEPQLADSIDPKDIPQGFQSQNPHASAGGDEAAQKQQAVQEQRVSILSQALTPDALERLNRIKLVKKDKVQALESSIINMVMSGRLQGRINEGKLIEMLERGNARDASQASAINFQRKKYAFDSDEDDDDDDV
mmetsp:Transcript_14012/g.18267  ORF Transcript_14012/g.18267 Transcript_14012/m.18267 type:complete len:134 (+) Transcript_14012:200-601(+)